MSTPYTIYDKYGQQYTFNSIFYTAPSLTNIKIIKTDGISQLVGQLHVSQYQSNIFINSNVLTNSNNIFTYDKNALISSFSPSIYNNNNILENTNTFNLCSRQSNTYDNMQPYLTVHKGVSANMHNTMVDIIASGEAITNKSTSARIRIDARNLLGKDMTGGYIKLQTINVVGGNYVDILSASNTGVNIIGTVNITGDYKLNGIKLNNVFTTGKVISLSGNKLFTSTFIVNDQFHITNNSNNILVCSINPLNYDIFTYNQNALISSFNPPTKDNVANDNNTFNLCSRQSNMIDNIQPYLTIQKGSSSSNGHNTIVDIIAQGNALPNSSTSTRIRVDGINNNIKLQTVRSIDNPIIDDILIISNTGIYINGSINSLKYTINSVDITRNLLGRFDIYNNYGLIKNDNILINGQLHINNSSINNIILNTDNPCPNNIFTYDKNALVSFFDPSNNNTFNLCSRQYDNSQDNIKPYLTVYKGTSSSSGHNTKVNIIAQSTNLYSPQIIIDSLNINNTDTYGGYIKLNTSNEDVLIANNLGINIKGALNVTNDYRINNISLSKIYLLKSNNIPSNITNNFIIKGQLHVSNYINIIESLISSNSIFTYDTNALVSSFYPLTNNTSIFNLCSIQSNISSNIQPYLTVTKYFSTLNYYNTNVDIIATGINLNNYNATSTRISINTSNYIDTIGGSINFQTIKKINGSYENIMSISKTGINIDGTVNSSNYLLNGISITDRVPSYNIDNINANIIYIQGSIHIGCNSNININNNLYGDIFTYENNILTSILTSSNSINLYSRQINTLNTSNYKQCYLNVNYNNNNTIVSIGTNDMSNLKISLGNNYNSSNNSNSIIFSINNYTPLVISPYNSRMIMNTSLSSYNVKYNNILRDYNNLSNIFLDNITTLSVKKIIEPQLDIASIYRNAPYPRDYYYYKDYYINNYDVNSSNNVYIAGLSNIDKSYSFISTENAVFDNLEYIINFIIGKSSKINYSIEPYLMLTCTFNMSGPSNGILNIIFGYTPIETDNSQLTTNYWSSNTQKSIPSGATIKLRTNISGYVNVNFTGQHRCISYNKSLYDVSYNGYIISTLNKYKNINSKYSPNNKKQNITINDSLPIVDLSTKANDKNIYGVISSNYFEYNDGDVNSRYYEGTPFFNTQIPKDFGDRRLVVNGLGEGGIWVTDYNGPLESGDYISSSPIPGLGMRQDDDIHHKYTVAKITMDCDFNPSYEPIQTILTSNYLTYDSTNGYHINNINVLDENNNPVYTNQLDIYGNIVHDYDYEMKYVTLEGTITSKEDYLSSSNIYRMAFVGCIYKCS